ncbi:hypothetical protein LU293_02000 [Moraxella nasovis]|uniref:hypothetical protein n=1 Tax=Moraxella nasovis TaxID=2904121 RepID=UPI001F613D82|nr:hypothetical protein [Moraxella nasovis]UNU73706.1 hypothetical protein LU293_02000 [Moraxella nasovis]
MTYLAPRQVLFAFVVLASLCLHILFFIVSEERQMRETYQTAIQQSADLLAQEMTVPLPASDRVSMSVIGKRYVDEEQIAFVGVYDTKDVLIVPVGNESGDGASVKVPVVTGDKALGSVVVKAESIGRASIIAKHWLFLLSSIALHAILWLLYGNLARPTQEMQLKIAKDVRNRLLEHGVLIHPDSFMHEEKSRQDLSVMQTTHAHKDQDDSTAKATTDELKSADDSTHQKADFVVQVLYNDPNNLLSAVHVDTKKAYFSLCTQLLEKAVVHLMTSPLVVGVKARVIKDFDDKGATVALYGEDDRAKVATAAFLLSKLVIMLNNIIYEKHRESQRFALHVKTVVSDAVYADTMRKMTKRHDQSPMLLLDEVSYNEVKVGAELEPITDTTVGTDSTMYQIVSLTSATTDRLQSLRDGVLLSDEN